MIHLKHQNQIYFHTDRIQREDKAQKRMMRVEECNGATRKQEERVRKEV